MLAQLRLLLVLAWAQVADVDEEVAVRSLVPVEMRAGDERLAAGYACLMLAVCLTATCLDQCIADMRLFSGVGLDVELLAVFTGEVLETTGIGACERFLEY